MKLATLAPDYSLPLVGGKDSMEVHVLPGLPVGAWLLGPKAWDLETSSLYSLCDSSLMSSISSDFLYRTLVLTDWPPVASRRGPEEGGRGKELSSFLQLLAVFAGVIPWSVIIY